MTSKPGCIKVLLDTSISLKIVVDTQSECMKPGKVLIMINYYEAKFFLFMPWRCEGTVGLNLHSFVALVLERYEQLHTTPASHPVNNSSILCIGNWVGTKASLDGFKEDFLVHARIQTMDHPDHSQSLYQLCYPWSIYHISLSHTTCTISDFSLFSSRLFRFASLRCRLSSFSFFLSSTKARECSLTRFSSSLKASFFSFDLLIPGVLITDENLL